MIDTREELINALSEAAEIEHGLLIQYLFAAYSMKRRINEGISHLQQAMLVDWEEAILEVAQQEMHHLAGVCNLLSAIGSAPRFERPNLPQPMDSFYPFDFQLERFSDQSLYRFIMAELPIGVKPPPPPGQMGVASFIDKFGPDPLVYNRVGELYQLISDGFNRIPEKQLFIGPKSNQDVGVGEVKDRQTADKVIRNIILEGEGAPYEREKSHYKRFTDIRCQFFKEIQKDPNFQPARLVVLNPQTRKHREVKGTITMIDHKVSLKLAELFNNVYTTMLLMLIQYYSFGGESPVQRFNLRRTSIGMMSAIIRPLAEVLTEMPAKDDLTAGNAGPGFEIYTPIRLAPDRDNRWIILKERFLTNIDDCDIIAKEAVSFPVLVRLNTIHKNLQYILSNLKKEFEA